MADSAGQGIRLNRFLASCGLGSRRKCETLITEGRVQINGTIVTSFGVRVQLEDHVRVDGRMARPESEITILLNKPKSYLCTRDDPEGRETIYDILPGKFRILNYVGRLDRESQGLILLTNSGDLNHQLTHPRHEVEKEYVVGLDRAFNAEIEAPKLLEGVHLYEGIAKAKALQSLGARKVSVVLTQGFNRQIRRMFAKLDYKVRSLERVRIGRLTAPDLSTGEHRVLGKRDLDLAGKRSLIGVRRCISDQFAPLQLAPARRDSKLRQSRGLFRSGPSGDRSNDPESSFQPNRVG